MDQPTNQTNSTEKLPMVHIIINPAAGQDEPFLKILNTTFKEAGLDYEILLTKDAGDAYRLAQEAVQTGADVVAAYGGDGTVIEVASGLLGSRVPLAILPGGTGNMMSKAYGIPQDFAGAIAMIVADQVELRSDLPTVHRRPVHIAQVGEHYFFQLVGIGMEAKIVEGADREAKDRMGMLAYGMAALQALTEPTVSHYRIRLDEEWVEAEGVTCLVGIVANLGRPNLSKALSSEDHPDQLDVMVLERANLAGFTSLLATVAGSELNTDVIKHWRACSVEVQAEPPQAIQADGEMLGETPVTLRMHPQTVQLIVPAPSAA